MSKREENRAAKLRQRRLREEQNLFSRLPSTYAASRRQGQKILQSVGLSIVEWRTLWDLAEAGPLTIREMADIQRTDHSLLSRALPAMRDKGLITMARDSNDGRQTIVDMTEAGRLAYMRAAPIMKRRREAMRAMYSPEELSAFVDYLDRLEEFLRQPVDPLISKEEETE